MNQTIQHIRDTLSAEIESLELNLQSENFLSSVYEAARVMKQSSNRVITTGLGKSGIIARKVAATLTSVGVPSFYLHPADALHGDMGNIRKGEVVLAFSNSGETREVLELLPHIKLFMAKLVGVTQKAESTLARHSDIPIIFSISREGCPLNLAPMASTTVSLAIGDALASALIAENKFEPKDFSRFHPSGALGRKLLTKVRDLMQSADNALIRKTDSFKETLAAMARSNLGCVLVVGSQGHLRGILTDGDLKRILDGVNENNAAIWKNTAAEIMTANPVTVSEDALAEEAIALMHEKRTYTLPVIDKSKKPVGVLRMHELIGFA